MNVLEIAIYAIVIGGQPQPVGGESASLKCVESEQGAVNCTNGLSASAGERDEIRFSNGIRVSKARGINLSNGITAHVDGAGWLEFSNGFGVRQDTRYRYRLSNGGFCQLVERTMAVCEGGR